MADASALIFEALRNEILAQAGIRARNVGLRQAILAADDVGALRSRGGFVESDHTVGTLPPIAAIGREEQISMSTYFNALRTSLATSVGVSALSVRCDTTPSQISFRLALPISEQFELGHSAVLHLQREDIAIDPVQIDIERVAYDVLSNTRCIMGFPQQV